MLETLIVVLLLLWLLGWVGPSFYAGIPTSGGLIHLLLVVILVLIIVRLR